jgi:hypothetical protein
MQRSYSDLSVIAKKIREDRDRAYNHLLTINQLNFLSFEECLKIFKLSLYDGLLLQANIVTFESEKLKNKIGQSLGGSLGEVVTKGKLHARILHTLSVRPLHNTTRHLSKPKKELFLGLFDFKKFQF